MESTLSLYKIFYTVANTQNISRASRELYISQPAISKAIQKLEQSLGVTLFYRNSRGVTLTHEGTVLYTHVQNAFQSISLGEEAVRRERRLMEPVRRQADWVIDTSYLSTAQLRGELLRIFDSQGEKGGMSVSVSSFGYKYGLPLEADLVLDVRFLPNPYYVDSLRRKTGMDAEVYNYVFSFPQTEGYMKRLKDLFSYTLPLYAEEGKTVLVIAVGCTGGHHRSVAVTRALAEYIRGLGYQVSENHRDMTRS